MSDTTQLINTIKRELKRQGLTYRDVAAELKLSEASVKRLFSSRRLTVERLLAVSRLLGHTLAELAQLSQAASPQLHSLTAEQESKLVTDKKLLLTAVCLLNQWALVDITARYTLSEAEVLKRALLLDRMGLLDLLPGNRVRLKVARDFEWRPDGAISAFFRSQGRQQFLDSPFDAQEQTHFFVQGMLTTSAQAQLAVELRRLRVRFASLHDEGVVVPMAQRHGVGLLLAMREWEPEAFAALRRSFPPAPLKKMRTPAP